MIIKCIKSIKFGTVNGITLTMPCRLDKDNLFIVSNYGGFSIPSCILLKEKDYPEGYEQVITSGDFRLLLKYNYIKIEE